METTDLNVGDVLAITNRTNRGDEERTAVVTSTTHIEGQVNYMGYYVDDRLPTGQGAFYPRNIGKKRFGTVKVEVIGHKLS